jgi:transcription elongation factor GreB
MDPSVHFGNPQVFFGATVTYEDEAGVQRIVTIKGIDEADSTKGQVSWVSPIARTLLKAREGDVLKLVMPQRVAEIEVVRVVYPKAS